MYIHTYSPLHTQTLTSVFMALKICHGFKTTLVKVFPIFLYLDFSITFATTAYSFLFETLPSLGFHATTHNFPPTSFLGRSHLLLGFSYYVYILMPARFKPLDQTSLLTFSFLYIYECMHVHTYTHTLGHHSLSPKPAPSLCFPLPVTEELFI